MANRSMGMKFLVDNVQKWVCHQCGHMWRIYHEHTPPLHCAKCRSRSWNRVRDIESEL
jgi:rubrerythrin